jgi:hypothetical protein
MKMAAIDAATLEKSFYFQGGGGGWIRTNVGLANGFTVRPL